MHALDPQRTGGLHVAAILLVLLCGAAARSNQALAQRTIAPPIYGGQIVEELVPFEADALAPELNDTTPIFLDECQEFCELGPSSADSNSSAVRDAGAMPAGFRKGFFQKVFANGTYIPRLENDSLGFHDLEMGMVFAVPFFRVTAPLLITPRFAVHYLDGPVAPDLPPRVYDSEVSFRHLRKFGNGPWAMNAAVTLGHYSDFEKGDADAFRVTGQAFAVYESSPAMKWVFGVVYLNRRDLSVIPAAGFIYEPTPNVKYEAIMPRPRVSWRLSGQGSNSERRLYLGGEFGGGIWSIQRTDTLMQDLLTYNDYRVLIGIESKGQMGLSRRLEAGYVFGRELEFDSATPNVRLDDSLFVRAGVTY